MDPNWRGPRPPSPNAAYLQNTRFYPPQPYPVQGISLQGGPLHPMNMDPSVFPIGSAGLPFQAAGQGQNPGVPGQGHQLVGQGQGVYSYSARDLPRGQSVMEMSRLQELPGDVIADCPSESYAEMNMTVSDSAREVRQGGINPMNTVTAPASFVPTPPAGTLYPQSYVPPAGNVVFVPPGHPVVPVTYSFPSFGPQFYPQGSVGAAYQTVPGPVSVGMDRPQQMRPARHPGLSSMTHGPQNPIAGLTVARHPPAPPSRPNAPGEKRRKMGEFHQVRGDGQSAGEARTEGSGGQSAFKRQSGGVGRQSDLLEVGGLVGQNGVHEAGVRSSAETRNASAVRVSLLQEPSDSGQPTRTKKQAPQSVHPAPVPQPLPNYPRVSTDSPPRHPHTPANHPAGQKPAEATLLRPRSPLRRPAQPRSSGVPGVRCRGPVQGGVGSEESRPLEVQASGGVHAGTLSDSESRQLEVQASGGVHAGTLSDSESSDEQDTSPQRPREGRRGQSPMETSVTDQSHMETSVTDDLSYLKVTCLLDVGLSRGGERLREVARRFVGSTYPQLWRRTYRLPRKTAVSQQHPDKALVRTREGEFRVGLAMEQLSVHSSEHLFILGDYRYESFLHHLSSAKVEAEEEGLVSEMLAQLRTEQQFGDFDLLIFHPQAGLFLFGLCSVGSNADVQYILKRVQKTRNQLERSLAVARRYVATLDLHCPVTWVLCTPNLKRPFLSKVTARDKHTERVLQKGHVLCSEQLPSQFRTQWTSLKAFRVLQDWWKEVKAKEQKGAQGQRRVEDLTLLLGCFLCPSLSKVDFDQTSPMPPSETGTLIQEEEEDASSASDTATKGESSRQSTHKGLNVSSLYLSIGSASKPFSQFTEEYVDLYFPHHLTQTYRVPPVHFNIQKIRQAGREGYDVLERPMSKDTRGDEGENRVVGALEILGRRHKAAGPMFILCDFQYNHYLNKLKESMFVKGDDRRPRRAFGQSVRAQHDCLLIHRRYGVIIISVKAVGDNFDKWASSGSDEQTAIRRTLGKVLKQLPREEDMVRMVLQDLTSDLPCIKLVALPNLHREDVDKAIGDDEGLKQEIGAMFPEGGTRAFLCQDELCQTEGSIWEAYEDRPDFLDTLVRWWQRSVGSGKEDVLSPQLYKQIIGRFTGLLSTVEVWSTQNPRVEVRNLEEAVGEVAERYCRIVLTPEQLDILHTADRRVFLSGPPGTGKTMLLVLRARQWAEQGQQVVVLNLSHGSAGLPLGHLLHKQVLNKLRTNTQNLSATHSSKDGGNQAGSPNRVQAKPSSNQSASSSSSGRFSPSGAWVRRFDLDSCVFDPESPGKLSEIPEKACIVMDEITGTSHPVLTWVLKNRDPEAVWGAGQYGDYCPQGWQACSLTHILRCPPMVQRLLKHTSYDIGSPGEETRAAERRTSESSYILSSAPQGLPTDGPTPQFISHSLHKAPSTFPMDCSACGNALADFLLDDLHLGQSTYERAKQRKLGPLPQTGAPLSLKDVVVVCRVVQACSFVTALKKRGLTVSVVAGTGNPMVAMPTHETIVFTTPFAMTGLERKVVVYLPFENPKMPGKEDEGAGEEGGESGKGPEEGESGEGESGGTKEEKPVMDSLRVKGILKSLSAEERVSLWYTASRCMSQLVVIVP